MNNSNGLESKYLSLKEEIIDHILFTLNLFAYKEIKLKNPVNIKIDGFGNEIFKISHIYNDKHFGYYSYDKNFNKRHLMLLDIDILFLILKQIENNNITITENI